MMSIIVAAMIIGVGLGITFVHNGSSGGTDIVAAIVSKRSNVANFAPTHTDQLKKVPYLGVRSIERYGADILQVIAQYLADKRNGHIEEQSAEPVKQIVRPGENTFDATLRLFKEDHMTIDQIAQLRELTPSTIMSHLSRFLPTGQVHINDIVTPEAYNRIKAYFSQTDYQLNCPLSEVRTTIGDDLSIRSTPIGVV